MVCVLYNNYVKSIIILSTLIDPQHTSSTPKAPKNKAKKTGKECMLNKNVQHKLNVLVFILVTSDNDDDNKTDEIQFDGL